MKSAIHFSSSTVEAPTPLWFFDQLDAEFGFTLDPCCTHESAKCDKHYTCTEDGLSQSWAGETVFMNPPYGKEIGKWMAKAFNESRDKETVVVCLVPARTDTAWWHDFASKGEIRFIRGRLKFDGWLNSAPFPSAVVIFK